MHKNIINLKRLYKASNKLQVLFFFFFLLMSFSPAFLCMCVCVFLALALRLKPAQHHFLNLGMAIYPPTQILLFFFFLSFLRFEETSLTYLQDLQATLNPDYVTGLNIRQQLSLLGAGGSLLPDLEAAAGS